MNFKSIHEIESVGFCGFKKISDLKQNMSGVVESPGVYLVLYLNEQPPQFLAKGSGGWFKGKNPNISIEELKTNWVKETIVIYIGQTSAQSLKKRIGQYMQFGSGKSVGHYGGRLIWQIENAKDLVLCWKALPNENPKDKEAELIRAFASQYGKRPFANLQG